MRNPVNRLATAAPRAFDSILKQRSTKSDSTTTTTTEYETRNRGASFDLSMLLNTTASTTTTTAEQTTGEGALGESSSVDETGSVMTFDAATTSTTTMEDMIQNPTSLDCYLGWNEDGSEVGL